MTEFPAEFLGTSACPACGSWGSVAHYQTPLGIITETNCPTCKSRIRVTTQGQGDVTDADDESIARVNPDYALADGRPLPIVILEESVAGQVSREWLKRWRDATYG